MEGGVGHIKVFKCIDFGFGGFDTPLSKVLIAFYTFILTVIFVLSFGRIKFLEKGRSR